MNSRKNVKIPADLIKVNALFAAHGFKAYLVGGAVRDMLRGKQAHDWDIATDATPQQVMQIFRRVIPTGIAHGTVTIHIYGHEIEATTFRTEASYSDGRHPDAVRYAATIEEDLSRRDFTMNAIAADLADGSLVDPFGGQEDIRNGIIRTVGRPLDRFNEDGLRPVRAIRFAGQLGFRIEAETFAALSAPQVLARTKGISPERFRDELCKMLQTEKPSGSLRLLEQTGIMALFVPGFAVCRGCIQADFRGFHEFDVADHLLYACDGAPKENLTVRLAAFFHDIGKPEARTVEHLPQGDVVHFHGHEKISAQKARQAMNALKFPNHQTDRVCHLVQEHMFFYESAWSDAAVRRFLIRVGTDCLDDIIALRLADIHGMHNVPAVEGSPAWLNLVELRTRVEKVIEEKNALSMKDLAVNGRDLIEAGIPAGKIMGSILAELFETVTDSPAMNEKQLLLPLARNIFEQKYGGQPGTQ